jgi:hypothetical protein
MSAARALLDRHLAASPATSGGVQLSQGNKLASKLEPFDLCSKLLLRSAEFFLETPEQLVIFSFGKSKIIVGQLSVFLFQLSFRLVPTAFEL